MSPTKTTERGDLHCNEYREGLTTVFDTTNIQHPRIVGRPSFQPLWINFRIEFDSLGPTVEPIICDIEGVT